jgi:hypothetical protein
MPTSRPEPIGDAFRRGEDASWSITNPTITVTPPADTAPTPLPNPTFKPVGEPFLTGVEQPPGM